MPTQIEDPATGAPVEQKVIGYTDVFVANQNSKGKVVVNVGGAGSSKSYSIAQLFIYKMMNEDNKTFGVIRKTFPSLRMTSYEGASGIITLLKQYGVYRQDKHNKTSNTYTYKDSVMWFFSLDEADKIKSTSFNYVWVEEANEITEDDYIILKTRLRAPTIPSQKNQIFLSLNPDDSFGWIPKKLCGIDNGNNN